MRGPDRFGLRLRTLEDVLAHAQDEGIEHRLDATEIQVRWPRRAACVRVGKKE
ncbi:hypothetical protein ACWEOV_37840 [Streptomyces sp. NPDC004365]|uniref:hypothetical protein n=1 Tax=Streptomyces sp. MBT84 TaxID=1488414 RepID=UPI001C6EC250|nr:hypothetical protein [Streptomyces sp. MBT84]